MANIVYMARSAWTGLLDTIRSKAGITGSMTVSQAADAVDSIETGGGGDDSFDRLVDRTITEARGSATNIGMYAFHSCMNLTTANFPSATNISSSAFAYCTRLTTANFPLVASIGNNAFYSCYSLTTANFPLVASIGTAAFYSCTRLTTISFPSATRINGSAFANCYTLLSLYLMGSSVPSLQNANAFNNTPISNYTTTTGGVHGSIFVPSSLYNQYISGGNWTVYSDRIVSVSE